MTEAKFKVAGVSRCKDGQVKVRFANDMGRVKLLVKDGQTDIELMDLPNEMTKPEICKFLLTSDLMGNPEFAEAIQEADAKYSPAPRVAKEPKAPKAPKVTKEKPSLEAIKARGKKEQAADKEPVAE